MKKPKNGYKPHISQLEFIIGHNAGRFIRGVLRVQATRTGRAYVSHNLTYRDLFKASGARPLPEGFSKELLDEKAPDVLIEGRPDRNRALHGDEVGIQIKHFSEWQESTDKFDDAEVPTPPSGQNNLINAAGEVVYVISNERGRSFVCTLKRNPSKNDTGNSSPSPADSDSVTINKSETFVRAVPIDNKYPWILINTKNMEMFNTVQSEDSSITFDTKTYYKVRITSWHVHTMLPLGEVISSIGKAGNYDSEETAALDQLSLSRHLEPHPQDVEDEAAKLAAKHDQELKCSIYKDRMDMRSECVFTIDPVTARDFDDAIHIKSVDYQGKACYEIGVHIADVSHFVKPGSLIDEEARWRTTTLYMPLRALPMLPRVLCDKVCSLRPEEDKFTFSVFLVVDETGNVRKCFQAKTIIRSKFRFSYEDADTILQSSFSTDEPLETSYKRGCQNAPSMESVLEAARIRFKESTGEDMEEPDIRITNKEWTELCGKITMLENLTQRMRSRRFEGGSVALMKVDIRNHFENKFPTGLAFEKSSTSHELIEELMLLANTEVAKKIKYDKLFSRYAILRRHPAPSKLSSLEKFISKVGISHDLSSSLGVMRTIINLVKEADISTAFAFCFLFLRTIKAAEYFVYGSGGNTNHFALHMEEYTHFTSPIRRYADLMVHRCVAACLRVDMTGEELASIKSPENDDLCSVINEKRLAAQDAGKVCQESMFALYLTTVKTFFNTIGIILLIQDKGPVVYLPNLGREFRMWYDAEDNKKNFEDQEISPSIKQQVKFPKRAFSNQGQATFVWDKDGEESSFSYGPFEKLVVSVLPKSTTPATTYIVAVDPLSEAYREIMEKEGGNSPKTEGGELPPYVVSEAISIVRGGPNVAVAR
eukprot:GHVP01019534.1.p1 GENE.GHVP01019534.1~~GHVP01019534.1.p1  ORF type:complete len:880 (-),score=149.55 GHVP01019534.1:4088-6727(-)